VDKMKESKNLALLLQFRSHQYIPKKMINHPSTIVILNLKIVQVYAIHQILEIVHHYAHKIVIYLKEEKVI